MLFLDLNLNEISCRTQLWRFMMCQTSSIWRSILISSSFLRPWSTQPLLLNTRHWHWSSTMCTVSTFPTSWSRTMTPSPGSSSTPRLTLSRSLWGRSSLIRLRIMWLLTGILCFNHCLTECSVIRCRSGDADVDCNDVMRLTQNNDYSMHIMIAVILSITGTALLLVFSQLSSPWSSLLRASLTCRESNKSA